MTRRPFALALLAVSALAGSGRAQGRPAPAPQQAPAGAQQPGQDSARGTPQRPPTEGPRPYRAVITAQARTDSGVFITHRIAERLYYEIPRAMLGREFLFIADQQGTMRGVR